jgi:hypothetical protein
MSRPSRLRPSGPIIRRHRIFAHSAISLSIDECRALETQAEGDAPQETLTKLRPERDGKEHLARR